MPGIRPCRFPSARAGEAVGTAEDITEAGIEGVDGMAAAGTTDLLLAGIAWMLRTSSGIYFAGQYNYLSQTSNPPQAQGRFA